jgi:hypothetical protein
MARQTLNTLACARVYLYKLLLRIKAVKESQDLPPAVRSSLTLSTDTAVLNLHARLCNSNPVKTTLPSVLGDIQRVLGVEIRERGAEKKKRLRAKDYANGVQESGAQDHKKGTADREETRSKGKKATTHAPEGDLSDSDDDLEVFNDRLASSSSDDGGGDGGDEEGDLDVEALERQLEAEGHARRPPKATQRPYDHEADLEISEDEELQASESDEQLKAPAPKKSSFIPSLSMGGYISGSGSDIEDIDVAPKKNRRGQRARQQIWEKKYGVKANHLKKQDRNAGWDPKRGATDGSVGKERGGPSNARSRGGRGSQRGGKHFGSRDEYSRTGKSESKHTAGGAIKARLDDNKPMHPSWQAAKMAKEKTIATAAFAGKKITFD